MAGSLANWFSRHLAKRSDPSSSNNNIPLLPPGSCIIHDVDGIVHNGLQPVGYVKDISYVKPDGTCIRHITEMTGHPADHTFRHAQLVSKPERPEVLTTIAHSGSGHADKRTGVMTLVSTPQTSFDRIIGPNGQYGPGDNFQPVAKARVDKLRMPSSGK